MIDKSTLFYDYNQSSARRSFCAAASRRKRQSLGSTRYRDVDEEAGAKPDVGGLSEPFQHDQADVDQYLQKASLSPFVPVPDPVARKMLELADAGPDDVSVLVLAVCGC